MKSFRDGLAISGLLVTLDPNNAGWQHALTVSYNNVGDVLVAQGNREEAMKFFRDGLAIRERLAKAYPNNAGLQHDLTVSYDRVGDVLVAQGNREEAMKSFRDSLARLYRTCYPAILGPPRSTAGNISSAGCLKAGPQYRRCPHPTATTTTTDDRNSQLVQNRFA